MAFQPRQYQEILDDMVNFVRNNTKLTDFEVGSVIRTILEASSLEDDEQYFQMVQLLDAFSIFSSSGADLEARVAEYDILRLQPASSVGNIKVLDGILITDVLAFDEVSGAITIELDDSSDFPTSGFPFTIRIGEGTVAVEDVAVSAHTPSSDTLTSAALSNSHNIGARVSLVSGVADKIITNGIQVQVAAAGLLPPLVFVTTETGIIVNGNYESTPIKANALIPGTDSNVGAGKISRYTNSPPFDGALVTNAAAFTGGRLTETDAELRDRALDQIQSLTSGTPLALKEAVLGVTDPVTKQRVVTANVLEDFVNDEVVVYVDDGTGFVPDQAILSSDALDATPSPNPGASTISILDPSDFSDEGFVVASPESVSQIELLEYTSIDDATGDMVLVGITANSHDSLDEVVIADVLDASANAGATFFQTEKFPIVRNTIRLWIDSTGVGDTLVLQILDTDYKINRGTGQIEMIGSGVVAGTLVVATYTYYTGLLYAAQRIIDGDKNDEANFPGIRCAGVPVVVETPTIRRVSIRLSITAKSGFAEVDLVPIVKEIVEAYISGLGIGEDIIVSEIIERAMSVAGMFNVFVQDPLVDLSVSQNELPVPTAANGDSLVTVS